MIFSDARNHASIIDGCRLSRAEVFVYDHGDVDHLAWGIERADGRGALIVTDSVFSMDGDVAPLAEIVDLAQRHGLRTVIDEAHGTGALGPGGRGALALEGLEDQVDVIVGTLGKALGSYGAFVACDRRMSRYLLNAARTFIFSTALPPPAVAGALAALELLRERPQRVDRLAANAAALRHELQRDGFHTGDSQTQIIPLIIGDADLAMRICDAALQRGVFAQAIRPPTVPEMTSRLRLSVMATHREDELARAARTLGRSPGRTASTRRHGAPEPEPAAVELVPPAAWASPVTPTNPRPHDADGSPSQRRRASSTSRRRSPSGAPRSVVSRRVQTPPGCRRTVNQHTDSPLAVSAEALRGCFVTGTDTGVGKTVVAAAIVARLRRDGVPVRAFKPLITGLDEPADPAWPPDHELLAQAAGSAPADVIARRLRAARLPASGGGAGGRAATAAGGARRRDPRRRAARRR